MSRRWSVPHPQRTLRQDDCPVCGERIVRTHCCRQSPRPVLTERPADWSEMVAAPLEADPDQPDQGVLW